MRGTGGCTLDVWWNAWRCYRVHRADLLFIVIRDSGWGSWYCFWSGREEGYGLLDSNDWWVFMRNGEMNRALEAFTGMQGENGRLNEVTIVCVLSINLIRICTPGGILQSYINLKDTKQLKNYIIIRSGHHHGIRSSLRPDRKQSTDTPCIYAQAPYEM